MERAATCKIKKTSRDAQRHHNMDSMDRLARHERADGGDRKMADQSRQLHKSTEVMREIVTLIWGTGCFIASVLSIDITT